MCAGRAGRSIKGKNLQGYVGAVVSAAWSERMGPVLDGEAVALFHHDLVRRHRG